MRTKNTICPVCCGRGIINCVSDHNAWAEPCRECNGTGTIEGPMTNADAIRAMDKEEPLTRERILDEAKRCVCGEREQDYGSPEDCFGRIAELWTAYIGAEFSPVDVAAMMALLKITRIAADPTHMDSWVDLAGYAACGGEIAGTELPFPPISFV